MLRASPQTERLIETIELLAARRHVGATATAIARHLGIDRASCYPMLRGLCHYGWLIRDPATKRFSLGPALTAVGATATTAVDVVDAARPHMAELADETDLACVLVCLSANELVVTEIAHPQNGRRPTLGLQIADTVPLQAPFGAVLVAWEHDRAHTAWLADGATRDAPDRDRRLRTSLQAIRRRGFAVEALHHPRDLQSELDDARTGSMTRRDTQATIARIARELGDELLIDNLRVVPPIRVMSLSAPIFASIGRATAALCLYDPPGMLQGMEVHHLGNQLATTAAHVSEYLATPASTT